VHSWFNSRTEIPLERVTPQALWLKELSAQSSRWRRMNSVSSWKADAGLPRRTRYKRAAAAEKEAQQERSAAQNAGQGEDAQDETRDLGALADIALGVVPDDVGLVVDLVEELVRRGRRERSADDSDDGTAAAGEQGAGRLSASGCGQVAWVFPP
jgi:hypothetical protein